MIHGDKTTLLVMDVQPGIVDRLANKEQYLTNVRSAIASAHKNKIDVIFIVVGFRAGMPEISQRNQSFSSVKESVSAATLVNPIPAIELAKNDIVVTKRRVSAFSGSDLEVILRAQNINHIVLSGIATSGVVLSTLREAADKDYRLTVLSDLCADFDDDVHRVLIEKVFPKQATVKTLAEWLQSNKDRR
jgi:nicotinamidase-related amidase